MKKVENEAEEATITIEKENPIDQEKIDNAQKDFMDFGNELQSKVYLLPGGAKTTNAILEFLETKAEFAAHESLGIVKAHDDVTKAKAKSKKELFLSSLCIEAVAYYVSKASGVGLKEATTFKDDLFMPINEAMARINEDKKALEELKTVWAAAAQGVELEDEQELPNQ
jgi:hypothetical protein